MFTGIIEYLGEIIEMHNIGNELEITIKTNISEEIKLGQSIACNGTCLTVTKLEKNNISFFISAETIAKTTIANWYLGQIINLELAMQAHARFDGHMVSGHIDARAIVQDISKKNDSHIVIIEIPSAYIEYIIDKGSIAIDGISLTINEIKHNMIYLNIIPHSWNNTNMQYLQAKDEVNIEIDLIAKYIKKLHAK